MANDDIEIDIIINGNKAVISAKEVQKALQQVGEETKRTDEKISNLEKTASKVGSLLAGYFSVRAVKGLIDLGDNLSDARDGLDDLAKKAGTTADVLTNKLQIATQGVVTNLDLMRLANRGLQLGIQAQDLDKVAAAAKRYSQRMGGDVTSAMEQLITATRSGRDTQLAGFATIKDGVLILDSYKTEIASAADEIDISTTSFKNWTAEIGESIAVSKDLALTIKSVRSVVEDLYDIISISAGPAVEAFGEIFHIAARGAHAFAVDVGVAANLLSQAMDKGIANVNVFKAYNDALEALKQTTEEIAGGTINTKGAFEKEAEAAKKAKEAVAAFEDTIKSLFAKLTQSGTKVPLDDFIQATQDINDALRASNGGQDREAYLRFLEKTASAWIATGRSVKEYTEAIAEAGDAQKQFNDVQAANKKAIEDALADAAEKEKQAAKALGEQIGQQIAVGVGEALSLAFQNGGTGEQYFQIIGNTLGSITSQAVTSATAEVLGPAAPIAGQIAGTLVDQFTQAIGRRLNSSTPGTEGRKAADKYFAELFNAERLAVIVKGEFKRIDDLVFKGQSPFGGAITGFGKDNNGFAALLGLDSTSAGGFRAVGSAFEEILGITEKVSGQIAAVLVNNVGGSLENLQILVQQTGVSFEEMGNAIIESFYKGNLSIQETAAALGNLQGLFEAGIPGAIGAVNEAWQNFQTSIAEGKGSRYLIDSIRDIGSEAQELGINTFPQLADQLVKVFGFSASQVAAFFQAMKAVGIQSVQELSNAATADLINVAANYQAIIAGLAPTFGPGVKLSTPSYSAPRYSSPKTSSSAKTKDAFDANKDAIKIMDTLSKKFKGNMEAIGAAADALNINLNNVESSITKMFKAGKIGAEEALNKFNKYKAAFSGGILGKTGAVGDAIKDLVKTGADGGIFTLNSFRGIITEAKEGNINTLGSFVGAFQRELGGGASNALRQALKNEGINNFKALQNASEETITRILGNMEKLGFPFEKTSKETKKLLKDVEKIGKTPPQEIQVILKVTTQADKNSQKIIASIPSVNKAVSGKARTGQGTAAR